MVPGETGVSGEQPEPRWPSSLVVPALSLQHHSCVLTAFAFCSMASCCLLGVFLVSGCYLGLLELCIGVALTAEPVWFPGTSVRLAGRPWLVSLGTDWLFLSQASRTGDRLHPPLGEGGDRRRHKVRVGEAGTGTAEQQWKTARSQMAEPEGSSACAEQTEARGLGQQRRKKDQGVRGKAELVWLNSVLQDLK